jgi:adenosine deaminase
MEQNKLQEIIKNYKNRSNGDLKLAMEELNKDFEQTKDMLIKLSYHLDATEKIYNDILNEYKSRGNK